MLLFIWIERFFIKQGDFEMEFINKDQDIQDAWKSQNEDNAIHNKRYWDHAYLDSNSIRDSFGDRFDDEFAKKFIPEIHPDPSVHWDPIERILENEYQDKEYMSYLAEYEESVMHELDEDLPVSEDPKYSLNDFHNRKIIFK
jgi:hypothetical protein